MYKIMNGDKEVKIGDKVRLLDGVCDSDSSVRYLQGIDGVVEDIDDDQLLVRFKQANKDDDVDWWMSEDFGFEEDYV